MNNRGQNQSHPRKFEGMYANPNQFPHSTISTSNPAFILSGGPRPPRHYVNQTTHNVNDMKNHNMPNLTHGQIQMLPAHIPQRQQALPHHIRPNAPRNLPRGPFQYQLYLPGNVAYQGNSNQAFYQFNPHQVQGSPTVIMPYLPNYSTNQTGMFYSTTPQRPIPMTNIQQGPQNPPVANMSNAQNSHGPSLIVQSQPMEIPTNSQPLQVPQQPSTTPMQQIPESRTARRKTAAIKIIDPNTGDEVVLDSKPKKPSADELEKMKVQSQFQSQVQSVVKKDDPKVSDTYQNNEGGEKVRNEFQSQVKKLIGETLSSDVETTETTSKAIEVGEAQLPTEVIRSVEENNTTTISNEEFLCAKLSTTNISMTSKTSTSAVSEVINSDKEIPPNSLPSSTLKVQSQSTDTTNILEDSSCVKKNTDDESSKPAKPKKSKSKKKKGDQQKNVSKDSSDSLILNVQPKVVDSSVENSSDPVVDNSSSLQSETNTHENKENESDNTNCKNEEEENIPQKSDEVLHPEEETIKNGIPHETVNEPEAVSKLPKYLDNLPYEEGQWSATNPDGKKVYSKSFLLKLCSESVCQKKPDILRNWGNITKHSMQHNSLGGMPSIPRSQSASATGFMPAYFKPGNNSQRGMPIMPGAKRNSSQGKTASKTAKPNTIHMSLSLREEVKLNQTENAWVPTAVKKATKNDPKNKDEEVLKTEEVNKSVRSILNKITPDNMVALTEKFKSLPIDTMERLEKTIDLVFEKAIEEQSFAPLYSSLCSAMQSVQVSCGEENKMTSFKKLIISKCQSLFELDKAEEMDSAKKLAEINSCKDPEKKKELQLEFEENERRLRKRSVGNCRFIGELFKQKILTPNIMMYCILNLVTKHVEEPLECLCNLLKTVGKELEQAYNLDETFNKLKALTSKEMKSKIPSRIRFMIQDVIDLRRDKWVPRRLDSKPKLINEIENDAKNEAIEKSMAAYRPEKRGDRGERNDHRGESRGSENKGRRGNDNEWNVVQNTKYKQQNYTIDQSKLQGFKESSSVTTLGPSSKWSFSNSAGNKTSSTFTSSNTFAALDDKKMMSSKNPSRKPVISESEERQRMMSGVASMMMPQFAQVTPLFNSSTSSQISKDTVEEPTPVVELDPEIANKINLQCKNIIQEYEQMHNLDDIIYSLVEDEKSTIRTRHEEFVKSLSIVILDSSPNSRTEAGKLFAELLSKKVLSMSDITQGINNVLQDWGDLIVDCPQFFSYIAAIITPLLLSKTASFDFNNLKDACVSIRPDNSSVFFNEILQKILGSKETRDIKENGGILWIYNKWRMSDYVPLDTFMPVNQLNKYFKNDRVGVFLLSMAMYDKMRLTDCKLLYDIMHSWISTNIKEEIIKCPQFVRALTIAIVIVCLKPNHSYEEFFDHVFVKLLTCYIRSEPLPEPEIQAREVQCLYGIQLMSAALEHPGGMVLKLFHKLYQDSVISKESFELWKNENDFKAGFDEDLETKTMAVVVLNSFFVSLSANESDEDETTDQ